MKRLNQVIIEKKSLDFIEEKIISLDGTVKDIEIGDAPITYNGQGAVQMWPGISVSEETGADSEKFP